MNGAQSRLRRSNSRGCYAASGSTLVLGQHVAEQRSLLDRVIERDVRVRQIVEPALRHVPLDGLAIFAFEPGHRVGLHIESRERERAFAGEANEIPVDEEKIES